MLTRVLVAINVVAYVWERFTGALNSDGALLAHGALLGVAVKSGEWWRIVTGAFLHGSDLHLLFNMIALWQVGTFVELIYGTPRMALIYAISLVGSGLAVTEFTPTAVTVGASGAIFGLFGALAVAGFRLGRQGRQLMQQTIGIIGLNLVFGFVSPNISNAGHLGGLVFGLLAGLPLFRIPRRPAAVAVPIDPRADRAAVTIDQPPDEEQAAR